MLSLCVFMMSAAGIASAQGIVSSDLYKLRSAGDVALSPDGSMAAYTIAHSDGAGRPYSQLHVLTLKSGATVQLAAGKESSSNPVWSPDGKWLAYNGTVGSKKGLVVSRPDGSGAKYIGPLEGTNHPLTEVGAKIAWAADSKRLAFVSATPGPETAEASGDPVVITRYLYKPDNSEGNTHFNDNKRIHIFVADRESGVTKQITSGDFYEHSIDWSPVSDEIVFVSHREPLENVFFNYDVFTVNASSGAVRRLTSTESAEYLPKWSPDGKSIAYLGTRRGITDLETTMEDTHVWLMEASGANRREIGKVVDNRQGPPQWSPDGNWIYFTVAERGETHLLRIAETGGAAETIIGSKGRMGSWSLRKTGLAYTHTGAGSPSELFIKAVSGETKQLTDLNSTLLNGKKLGAVEPFTFVSNDFKFEVEAYLTRPADFREGEKYPLIVVIHGGPHGNQGAEFNFKNQVYASRGWATLMVNYRGSTSYGQRFADAVFGDQNGSEAQDVLYGLSAAMRRNLWIDRDRLGCEGGSYGGQLTAWLVTQTRIFKAAIPLAPIINLVSYNYMTYYNMYEQMTYGVLPHQGANTMDELWRRSSLRYAAQVATPVMLIHGENDADVPIAESEQFYIALKDVGVKTVMVRYPREGHGLREPKHIVDSIERSMRWYAENFPKN
jgi:dipeptidyl aminopeptidase/acylaminoacyl peptidase